MKPFAPSPVVGVELEALACSPGKPVPLPVSPTMTPFSPTNPAPHVRQTPRLGRLAAALTLAAVALPLNGCLSLTIRRHSVDKTVRATHVLDQTLDQLNHALAEQYSAIHSLNASVDIQASTGGAHQGEVQEIPSFAGYILFRRPADLHVIMLAPVVRSRALDMVTDGTNFKLLLPTKEKAIMGSDQEVETPNKDGLYNLRPYIIRDALLIPPVSAQESVSRTQNNRILPPAPGKKYATEEPDYDLTVTRPKTGNELETIRVIHISRVTLKPYEQDIYDHAGRLVTIVTYDGYKPFGDMVFPTVINITRPIDEYALKITINKLTFNQTLDDEQFVLKIPDSVPITKMP